ncbi:MAG: hypothetical protein KF712_17355 [Akkermansiaceae bacterium]|nr:hypothetical protein [Akkermansiaceae bacterium]
MRTKLKSLDFIALVAGSLAVWIVTSHVTERFMDGQGGRVLVREQQPQPVPKVADRQATVERSPAPPATPSPTPSVNARNSDELREELAKLAAGTLCDRADAEASRKCGRQFLMAAKSAGFPDDDIAAFLMDGMAARDPELALYLLGMIQPPEPLWRSQDKILKEAVTKDPVAAMRMILEFPPGSRFSSALGTLARNLPKDAELPGRVAELLAMLPEGKEREMLIRGISLALGDGLRSRHLTEDYLTGVMKDKRTGTGLRHEIASTLWSQGGEKPSLEKARRIMEEAGGEMGSGAGQMSRDLLRRDVPVKDLMDLARNADEVTFQEMLRPLLESKRMTFEELRDAAVLAAAQTGRYSWNHVRDVANEAGRLPPEMDSAMAVAMPADKRDAYRYAMVSRDLLKRDFTRAMANAESMEDPKRRADTVRDVARQIENAKGR